MWVSSLPAKSDDTQIHFASFSVETMDFAKVDINVDGIKDCRIFLDGKKNESGKANLEPGTHEIVLKYLTGKDSSEDGMKVSPWHTMVAVLGAVYAGRSSPQISM